MGKPYRGPLSGALLKRTTAESGAQVYPLRALCERYGMISTFEEYWQSPDDSPDNLQLSNRFWCKLALNLSLDFVPAFRTRKRTPGKKGVADIDAWIKAGGSFDTCPNDFTNFHRALFVKTIREIAREMKQSQNWVFKWLQNEEATTGPKKAAERLGRLPRPFRHYRSSGTLRGVFFTISREIRNAPEKYLPGFSDTSTLRYVKAPI